MPNKKDKAIDLLKELNELLEDDELDVIGTEDTNDEHEDKEVAPETGADIEVDTEDQEDVADIPDITTDEFSPDKSEDEDEKEIVITTVEPLNTEAESITIGDIDSIVTEDKDAPNEFEDLNLDIASEDEVPEDKSSETKTNEEAEDTEDNINNEETNNEETNNEDNNAELQAVIQNLNAAIEQLNKIVGKTEEEPETSEESKEDQEAVEANNEEGNDVEQDQELEGAIKDLLDDDKKLVESPVSVVDNKIIADDENAPFVEAMLNGLGLADSDSIQPSSEGVEHSDGEKDDSIMAPLNEAINYLKSKLNENKDENNETIFENSVEDALKNLDELAPLEIAEKKRWNPVTAIKRLNSYLFDEYDNVKVEEASKAFLLCTDPENFDTYQFPIADVVNGKLVAVGEAIDKAANLINSPLFNSRNIYTEEQINKMKLVLEAYYKKMGKPAPWAKSEEELLDELDGKVKVEQNGSITKFAVINELHKQKGDLARALVENVRQTLKK